MPDRYNFIYNKLVKDNDDVAGILAYSVYKRQKIEFIKENAEKDLPVFRSLSNSSEQLDFYKNEAAKILQVFAQTYLEEDLGEREEYFKEKLKVEVAAIKPKFITGVYQGILGSYGFLLSFGILFFIVWASKLGIEDLVETIFNVTITHN